MPATASVRLRTNQKTTNTNMRSKSSIYIYIFWVAMTQQQLATLCAYSPSSLQGCCGTHTCSAWHVCSVLGLLPAPSGSSLSTSLRLQRHCTSACPPAHACRTLLKLACHLAGRFLKCNFRFSPQQMPEVNNSAWEAMIPGSFGKHPHLPDPLLQLLKQNHRQQKHITDHLSHICPPH